MKSRRNRKGWWWCLGDGKMHWAEKKKTLCGRKLSVTMTKATLQSHLPPLEETCEECLEAIP